MNIMVELAYVQFLLIKEKFNQARKDVKLAVVEDALKKIMKLSSKVYKSNRKLKKETQ